MLTKTSRAVSWMKKYLRYTDYIGAAQLYLKDNFLMEYKLKPEHIKERILGHWGTVPGLNFVYAGLNYLVCRHECEMMLIVGPGHGAPAVLANLFAEGTLNEFYKGFPVNGEGMGKIIHDFSWPHTPFPSHVTPTVPGSILEGGELGYSLSTAYGAAFDNPNLIVAVVVGDGEAETGPTATAWHSNKFLNPKNSGAVLPIVHVNGYKISNPTIYGTMSNEELVHLFKGYGYEPLIVDGKNLHKKMIKTLEKAYAMIMSIQKRARNGEEVLKPKWPVIVMRTLKGWTGIHQYGGHPMEGSFRSHGIPLGHPKSDPKQLEAVNKWLKSYKVQELLDEDGRPKEKVMRFVPKGGLRIGMNKHAIGGNVMKELKLPKLEKYEFKFKKRGEEFTSSMEQSAKYLRDIIKNNKKNFLILCPDELESNKLTGVFEATKRGYVWPLKANDENMAYEGRVHEMLSEHTLQGWLQGYILTGRYGIFVTYEAFATIIDSMVDQYAKFIKQSLNVKWRKPIPSAVYVLSSLGWRQDHNGYSHQNPSFVSNVLNKHGEFCQIYYPSDSNSLLVAFEEVFKKKNSITVIVAGKTDLPEWLSLAEAKEQAKKGIGIWEWVGGKDGTKNPDVVLASAGDYVTQEAILGAKLCKEMMPELKFRYVNVSELTSICLGDKGDMERAVNQYFTDGRPVVFNYHGYVNDVEQILWPYTTSARFSIHGYKEEGSTTTPFDMTIRNGVSCYHIAIDMIEKGAKKNKAVAKKKDAVIAALHEKISEHQRYIAKHGDDPEWVKKMRW
ncbi:MAG: phosphoketolase family protein [Candidatus Gracilibacteria bacterium]